MNQIPPSSSTEPPSLQSPRPTHPSPSYRSPLLVPPSLGYSGSSHSRASTPIVNLPVATPSPIPIPNSEFRRPHSLRFDSVSSAGSAPAEIGNSTRRESSHERERDPEVIGHGAAFWERRAPSPAFNSGIYVASNIKRTASYSSFLSSKSEPVKNLSKRENAQAKSTNSSNRKIPVDSQTTTLSKIPTYEYYGFVLYLGSFITFGIYLIWAYTSDDILRSLGITYYPSRYWALALPTWTMVLIVFIVVSFMTVNLMNTAPFDSFYTITDEHALVLTNQQQTTHHMAEDHIPDLHDIPIGIVNAVLFRDLSKVLVETDSERTEEEMNDYDEEEEVEAERERPRRKSVLEDFERRRWD